LKVTPCEECASREVCKLNHSLSEVMDVLARFGWFFKGGEAHLSFDCSYYVPKAEEVGK